MASARAINAGARAQFLDGSSLVLALALVLAMAAGLAIAAPAYPELTGQIVDNARLMTAQDRAAILAELQALEKTSTDQIAVVTVPSLEGYTIEDYGIGLARKWQIGQQGKDNGALLIVAPTERKVRIEVGRKLEPILTDTMSKLIIENSILPHFRRGDFPGGIRAGVRDMKDVLLGDTEAVKERARSRVPQDDPTVLIHLAIWIAIILLIIYLSSRSEQRTMGDSLNPYDRRRSRRRRRPGVIIIPGGSGDWGGGWSGGSGGGWSGGGGGFGGGGASGSW